MQFKLIFCITRGWSYPNIDITRKSLMPSLIEAAANCSAEMTCHTVRRLNATTSHHLQTSCHPQVTTISVQSVATQHIGMGSHAQQKSTSVRHVINLGTLQVNVSKRSSIIKSHIDDLKHTRYKLMGHTLTYAMTHQRVVQQRTHSAYKSKYKDKTRRIYSLLMLIITSPT